MTETSATLYVHFPYCLQKCPYCDFVSYATERNAIDHVAYADAVIREATARASLEGARPGTRRFQSLFFGGGTPSLWEPDELARVTEALRGLYPCSPDLEITVECNPSSLDEERANALVARGVTRLSVGTQSLRKDALAFLGRLHDGDGAIASVNAAQRTGARVSTDMIFGLPDQPADDAVDQATTLANLGLSHLSCYQLTIEAGTRFGELSRRGRLPKIDDGAVAESFLAIDEALGALGLRHYEISNYARPGEESRHNLGYWRGWEYVGLGTGAYGFVRTENGGVRYRNEVLPERYMQKTGAMTPGFGEHDGLTITTEPLDRTALLRERIMLGLRLAEGMNLEAHGQDVGIDPWTPERKQAIAWLEERNRLKNDNGVLKADKRAWLFADDTAARLF